MSISLWQAPVQLFASLNASLDDEIWLRSKFAQAGNPVIVDAVTAANVPAGSATDDVIYLQAQNWLGDIQAPLKIAGTGPVTLPFAPFAAATVTGSGSTTKDAVVWWTPSAIAAGAYDLEFQSVSDNVLAVDSTTPALATVGPPVTLYGDIVAPQSGYFATNGGYFALAFAYAPSVGASRENITLQLFTPSGAPISAPVLAAAGIPTSTVYGVGYFPSLSQFEFIESATVSGVRGFNFSSVDATTGALGAATFQAVPLDASGAPAGDPLVIDRVDFSPLNNGDLLEFVGFHDAAGFPYWQGVETRLLNSSLQDITSSTPGFVSANSGFSNIGQNFPAHWDIASLSNGDTILIYTLNGVVIIEQISASGNQSASYGFSPDGQSAPSPTDFDSIVAMGSRFEVTYRTGANSAVYAVIYDTATQSASYTINDNGNTHGQWVGTPFDDTISYGAGINEINGGGGADTFVAAGLSSSQVSLSVDASNRIVFAVDASDIDTLERFTTIQLADATASVQGNELVEPKTDGTKIIDYALPNGGEETVAYNAAGDLIYANSYTPAWGLVGFSWEFGATNDLNGDGVSDILWRNAANGATETWFTGAANGGYAYADDGAPSLDWRIAGTGHFSGGANADILWRNTTTGDVYLYLSNGHGGFAYRDLGVVSTDWRIASVGDFSGDGYSDILWRNANGDIELWNASPSGGFSYAGLGKVTTDWQIAATGNFAGDGRSDILWRNKVTGDAYTWFTNTPPPQQIGFTYADDGAPTLDWNIAGAGDFNGDGKADILWRNGASGDVYLYLSGAPGSFNYKDLGAVPLDWTIAQIGDFNHDGIADILWRNTTNGADELWFTQKGGGFTYKDAGAAPTNWSIAG